MDIKLYQIKFNSEENVEVNCKFNFTPKCKQVTVL